MPLGLKRFQQSKQSHFVTFSCNKRLPLLSSPILRDIFIRCLEKIRRRYQFRVFGYVVMPEHVHLLLSEPDVESVAKAIQALKVSFVRQVAKRPTSAKTGQMWGTDSGEDGGTFWQKRYYDHNVRSAQSFATKLRYIHRNPVARGLCEHPMDWRWSSFSHYATAEVDVVEIESEWTAKRRAGKDPHLVGQSQTLEPS